MKTPRTSKVSTVNKIANIKWMQEYQKEQELQQMREAPDRDRSNYHRDIMTSCTPPPTPTK